MPRSRNHAAAPIAGGITIERAARLYRIIGVLRSGPKSRADLLKHLQIDIRGFYRDLEKLRELGIGIALRDHRYRLAMSFDDATSRLPFPDPQLNVREAVELARGRTPAHRKLKQCLAAITGKPAGR